jgi:predicted GTPase
LHCTSRLTARTGITDQDLRIAEHILNSKATTIVVVNKWDQSKESKQKVHASALPCGGPLVHRTSLTV